VSAVLFFGLLLGFFALPAELRASNGDVPLMLYTQPELEQSAFGTSLGNMGDDALVIEAYVDATAGSRTIKSCRNPTMPRRTAAVEKPADFHYLPARAFHGTSNDGESGAVVLEDQREGLRGSYVMAGNRRSCGFGGCRCSIRPC